MIITAKFASVCPCCSARIDIGSKVEWSKGAKAVHVACAGKAAPVATHEPLSLDGESAIRARSQRGHGPAVRLCAGGCGRRVGPRYAECYGCKQESAHDR